MFGRDWLGSLYAADFSRDVNGWPTVLALNIDFRDAMDTRLSLTDFHETALLDDAAAILNLDLYRSWLESHPPLRDAGRAVGYRIPLALGGEDSLSNMEESDLDVYWQLTGQIGQSR